MILVDANLLIYTANRAAPQHERACAWLDRTLTSPGRVGLPWASLLAYLRLATNRRIHDRPPTMAQAWKTAQGWLGRPNVWIPQPTERHDEVLGRVITEIGDKWNLVPDAHLAALAIEHGLILCSADRDFARFSEVRWENPLST